MVRHLMIAMLLMLWPVAAQAAPDRPSALLVVSSHGRGGGELQPGFEMDELSQAWVILTANGFAVDIASPEGGKVVADEYDAKKPYNASFLADPVAAARLADTRRLAPEMATKHDIVLIVGGKGAMFDLPVSQVLQQIILDQYQRGGVIAAVCHGPAVFANITGKDGKPFVAGKTLTGFANEEEEMFGKKWVKRFPFLIETRFVEQGARFGEAPIMLPFVAVDGKVVTGQNPYSVAAATEAAIEASGHKPKVRTMWPDERATHLLAQAAAGDRAPLIRAIDREPTSLDIPLVAIWAYYRALQLPDDGVTLGQSIETIKLARPHVNDPNLGAALGELERRYATLCPKGQCPTR